MDYRELAKELLYVWAELNRKMPHQKLSQPMRGELFVLNYLATHEHDVHPKELSESLNVSTARIANLLNQLEKKGLILRHVDPSDNRQLIVVPTEGGRQMAAQVSNQLLSGVAQIMEILGPEDSMEYLRIQKKILEKFNPSLDSYPDFK